MEAPDGVVYGAFMRPAAAAVSPVYSRGETAVQRHEMDRGTDGSALQTGKEPRVRVPVSWPVERKTGGGDPVFVSGDHLSPDFFSLTSAPGGGFITHRTSGLADGKKDSPNSGLNRA